MRLFKHSTLRQAQGDGSRIVILIIRPRIRTHPIVGNGQFVVTLISLNGQLGPFFGFTGKFLGNTGLSFCLFFSLLGLSFSGCGHSRIPFRGFLGRRRGRFSSEGNLPVGFGGAFLGPGLGLTCQSLSCCGISCCLSSLVPAPKSQ